MYSEEFESEAEAAVVRHAESLANSSKSKQEGEERATVEKEPGTKYDRVGGNRSEKGTNRPHNTESVRKAENRSRRRHKSRYNSGTDDQNSSEGSTENDSSSSAGSRSRSRERCVDEI